MQHDLMPLSLVLSLQIGALCLLHSYYWFTTVIGVVLLIGLGIYAYSIKQQTTNVRHAENRGAKREARIAFSSRLLAHTSLVLLCSPPPQFVLLYVSIVLVNLLKNVLILYFFFTDVRHGHRLDTYEYFLAILLCVDVVLLTVRVTDHSGQCTVETAAGAHALVSLACLSLLQPTSLYSCFFLHRSISLTNLTF